MINGKNLKIKQINVKLLVPCVLAGSVLLSVGTAFAAEGGGENSLFTVMGPILVGWALSLGLSFKKPKIGVLLASLMGLGISVYLGLQHNAAAGASMCNISSTINCDFVNRSEYSELFGYPIAFLGSSFYAGLAYLSFAALSAPQEHRLGGKLTIVVAAGSVLYSLYLAYISKFVVGAWCLFCIGMYGVNLILLLAGWLWDRQVLLSVEAETDDLPPIGGYTEALLGKDDSSLGAILPIFMGVLFLGGLGFSGGEADTTTSEEISEDAWYLVKPEGVLELDGTEPVYGNPDARYTVVEFADFECPYCGMVAPELKKVIDENPEVKMLFKHYPISSICNEYIPREGHTNACGAAVAADCAGEQGQFWPFNAIAFKNQKYLSDGDRLFLAEQIGLDMASFKSCVAKDSILNGVKADIAAADKVGLHGTPTIYIRGFVGDKWAKIDGTVDELKQTLKRLKRGDQPPAELPVDDHAH
jgi:protein-disulfide isomerase/uncharacterized membrane protein